ncbi:hypothetical protein [Marinobacter sp.]|mgnify:FL=1|uniref:hypothetical protein n=1 Tax=Marinobacter sp. TaxID=50741 RepID=UPI002357073A|nr:hypothetical protein [Marinobacter sp.]
MSLIMSPTKKTDKKQAKPKRFEKLSHEERMKMSYKDIQTHLVYAEREEDKLFRKWTNLKIYRKRTQMIVDIIKHVHNEKKPKRGKK